MVALLLWSCVARKIIIIEDKLLLDMLEKYHHCGKWPSELGEHGIY